MNNEQLIHLYIEMAESQDWYLHDNEIDAEIQKNIDEKKFIELETLFQSAFNQLTNGAYSKQIASLNSKYTDYCAKLCEALDQVIEQATKQDDCAAIYYELADQESNFFLCKDFDRNDDDWASDFDYDGVVNGPDISFSKHEFYLDLNPAEVGLYLNYTNTRFVTCMGSCIEKYGEISKPIAMAMHDNTIYYFS